MQALGQNYDFFLNKAPKYRFSVFSCFFKSLKGIKTDSPIPITIDIPNVSKKTDLSKNWIQMTILAGQNVRLFVLRQWLNEIDQFWVSRPVIQCLETRANQNLIHWSKIDFLDLIFQYPMIFPWKVKKYGFLR